MYQAPPSPLCIWAVVPRDQDTALWYNQSFPQGTGTTSTSRWPCYIMGRVLRAGPYPSTIPSQGRVLSPTDSIIHKWKRNFPNRFLSIWNSEAKQALWYIVAISNPSTWKSQPGGLKSLRPVCATHSYLKQKVLSYYPCGKGLSLQTHPMSCSGFITSPELAVTPICNICPEISLRP